MTDHKELIERLREEAEHILGQPDFVGSPDYSSRLICQAADALEAAQAQMQEAVERATAVAYGAANDEWQNVKVEGGTAMAAVLAYASRIRALTPQSARDWLAAHDKEIVELERERCVKIADYEAECCGLNQDGEHFASEEVVTFGSWTAHNISAAIRAGGK